MRKLLPAIAVALFAACSNPSSNADPAAADTAAAVRDTPMVPESWTGYYTDTLPCADCPGIDTWLWVRGDSTYVLRQQYIDRDSIPQGSIGQWHVVNGLLTTGADDEKPEFWRWTKDGLTVVDEMGALDKSSLDWSLDKLADDIGDAIPRMRLTGAFTYQADAQSFRPCGTHFNWPCVGGMDMGEEEGEPLITFTNEDLLKAYRKAVKSGEPWNMEAICTMGMGPAMEGDGADEYIFIEQLPRTITTSCP